MTRYKAFTLHLIASSCVLGLIFLLIAKLWYPGKLFMLAAGFDLLRLIVGVDLVIGPLLMLVIFDARKKYIKLDVAILLLCQVGFLGYGCWVMFTARPAYFVFAENRFVLVRANEIDSKDLKLAAYPEFKQIPLTGPIFVATKEPDDIHIKNDIALSSVAGMGIQNLPEYFVPYQQMQRQVVAVSKASSELKLDQSTQQRIATYEKNHPDKSFLFLPIVNKRTPLIAVINATTGQVTDVI